MVIIPIIDAAVQEFALTLNNKRCSFRWVINVWADRWSMDLAIDDDYILRGRRIVTGVDLIAPFGFGIGRLYAVPVAPGIAPTRAAIVNRRVLFVHADPGEGL